MPLDKTIRKNEYGGFIEIYSNHFEEGIEFASQESLPEIHIKNALGDNCKNVEIDFEILGLLSNHLRVLAIQDTLNNVNHSEGIYSLTYLEEILIEKQKFTLDISRFENLKHFGGTYWKGLVGIEKAYSLKSTVLIKLPDVDMKRVSALTGLESLHVYSSKIQSLDGIENLPIKRLNLARNNLLEDIDAIKNLKKLERLSVEKCKKIMDHELLEEMRKKTEVRTIK